MLEPQGFHFEINKLSGDSFEFMDSMIDGEPNESIIFNSKSELIDHVEESLKHYGAKNCSIDCRNFKLQKEFDNLLNKHLGKINKY